MGFDSVARVWRAWLGDCVRFRRPLRSSESVFRRPGTYARSPVDGQGLMIRYAERDGSVSNKGGRSRARKHELVPFRRKRRHDQERHTSPVESMAWMIRQSLRAEATRAVAQPRRSFCSW